VLFRSVDKPVRTQHNQTMARLSLLLLAVLPVLHAIPISDVGQVVEPKLITKKASRPNITSGADSFNPLDLVRQFCQGNSVAYQCGSAGNCEDWTTGNQSGGSNPGRISCNSGGQFCAGGCYAQCMDKSPDTKVVDFSYMPGTQQAPVPEAVFVHYIDNYLNITVTGNYQWQESVQTQYQWSWDVTASVSVTLDSTVGLPGECSIHDSVTASVSTTAGQSQSKTNTQTWSAQQNYEVLPQTTVKLVYIVSKTQFLVPYQQTVQFGATVAYWCSNQVDGHDFWMPSAAYVMDQSPWCDGDSCTFTGTFDGVQGVSDSTSYQYCDLGSRC